MSGTCNSCDQAVAKAATNRQAPAAEALITFIQSTAIAAQAIPGADVRMGVLRWANDQGYNADVRIALGNLVTAIVNADPIELGVQPEIVPGTGVRSHADWAAYERAMSR